MEILNYTRSLLQKNNVKLKLTRKISEAEELPTIKRVVKFTGIVNQHGFINNLFPVNNIYEDNSIKLKSVMVDTRIIQVMKYYEKIKKCNI